MVDALPSLSAKLNYLAVLQGLLGEGVPVRRQDTILELFQQRNRNDPVTGTVEMVRQQLRDALPGNAPANTFLRCGSAFEKRVQSAVVPSHHGSFLALAATPIPPVLVGLREAMAGRNAARVTLVTGTPGLRPFLRQLAALEFPDTQVLDERELLPELASREDGTVGCSHEE